MIQFLKIYDLKNHLSLIKQKGKTVGLVPTMGALHKGHLSLITEAKKKTDFTVVSIFVNPAQFNDLNDYKNYPRDIEEDIRVLSSVKCDFLFIPTETEIYPNPDIRTFELGNLEKLMEGRFRKNHFQGVVKVVTRLFDIVEPDFAFFGEKDFQQLAVIKKMVHDLNYNIKIISCPTLREKDGLAMSSRNKLLNPDARLKANFIYQILCETKKMQKKQSVSEIKNWVTQSFNQNTLFKLEYFEIVNIVTLEEITDWNDKSDKIGCIATWLDGIRLIDNIKYYS